jgi:hypothetical protein
MGEGMSNVYHSGEKEVQARAGVREMADRIGNSIRSTIPLAAREFLRRQPLAILSSVDVSGRVWASVLTGEPGFLQVMNDHTIRMDAVPIAGDPLTENLRAHDQLGLLAIEFSTRQRMRVNGIAEVQSDGRILLTARQVYSNCQKYIQARAWKRNSSKVSQPGPASKTETLTVQQEQWIAQADTFFIASFHPEAGADASHRGGNPGFIRIDSPRNLVWPDYLGNMMFQTLGNITTYPQAGLLFIDFEKRNTLQLTGKARICWDSNSTDQFAGADRLIRFSIEEVIEIADAMPFLWDFQRYSPHNPV